MPLHRQQACIGGIVGYGGDTSCIVGIRRRTRRYCPLPIADIRGCRESDCVVRWGGEEFLIVSRFADRDEAPLMSERIRKSIEKHDFELPNGGTLKKTCSIGFACYPFLRDQPLALSWEQVIDIADRALYAAKKSGRNRCIGITANQITDGDVLYQRICSDIQLMIDNKELTVISNTDDKIIWE